MISLKAVAAALKKLQTLRKVIPTEQSDEKGNKIIILVISLLFTLIIIPAAAISLPGLLAKNFFNTVSSTLSFKEKIEDTKIYQDCYNVYMEFESDYNDYVYDEVEYIKKNNPIGETETGIPIAPEVYIYMDFDSVDIYYLLAYINTKYYDYQLEKDGFKFKKTEIRNFLDNITTFETSYSGTDPIYYNAHLSVLTLEQIADKYFSNAYTSEGISKKEMFIESYHGLKFQ